MLKTPDGARRQFNIIDADRSVSILGLNDDIEMGYDQVVGIMRDWFEGRWPDKAPWERS